MGLIREPREVDFIIQGKPWTHEEEQRLSDFITQRKQELAKSGTPTTSPAKRAVRTSKRQTPL
jgi:hypothetical protein